MSNSTYRGLVLEWVKACTNEEQLKALWAAIRLMEKAHPKGVTQ